MNLKTISQAIIRGDLPSTTAEVNNALEKGSSAGDILHKACIPAMIEVGRMFESGEIFVPEMLVSARAMQGALDNLRPHLVEGELHMAGKVVIGTVSGDLHDIGKNLVCIMFEGAGFEVIDRPIPERLLSLQGEIDDSMTLSDAGTLRQNAVARRALNP